jgi:ketosteroid isomerase-like protein
VDTHTAVRRWIHGWTRGWSAHDPEPISALYAPDAVFVSHPFRAPQAPREYAVWAFADEESADFRFGEPLVDDGCAAVEYWAVIRSDGGE